MVKRIILFLAFLGLFRSIYSDSRPLPFPTGSFKEIKALAAEQQKPFIVYFYQKDTRTHKKFVRKTWMDKDLRYYLNHNYLVLGIDAFSDKNDVELIQELKIFTFPSLVFFNPNGKVLGKASGFLAANTLQSILEKHVRTVKEEQKQVQLIASNTPKPNKSTYRSASPALKSKPQIVGYLSDLQSPVAPNKVEKVERSNTQTQSAQAPVIIDNAKTYGGMVSRGQMETKIHLDIPGMDTYSLKKLDQTTRSSSTLGLLIGSYTSYKKLKEEVGRFKRFWKGAIWVYAEEVDSIPVYKLVLGAYPTRDEAEVFANAIYKFEKTTTSILDLALLVK